MSGTGDSPADYDGLQTGHEDLCKDLS